MRFLFNLIFLFIIIVIIITVKRKNVEEVIKKNKNIEDGVAEMEKKEKDIKEEKPEFYDYQDFSVKSILNIKKRHYGTYRNYPNQNSLRRINRKKPRYTINYYFSNINVDAEKLNIESLKYSIKEEQEQVFFNKKELPFSYFNNEIVLIPKNSNTLFAYWEISEEKYQKILKENEIVYENPLVVIKTVGGEEKFNIECYSRQGSMYIENLDSNVEYIAHLGFLDKDNNFIEVAYSSNVSVPSKEPSNNFEVNWGIANVVEEGLKGDKYIEFKEVSKKDAHKFVGYQQEILDREVLILNNDEEKSLVYKKVKFLGSSENEVEYIYEQEKFVGSSNNFQ